MAAHDITTTPAHVVAKDNSQSVEPAALSDQFVTVIVPIRNERQHIGACLNSILGCEWPDDQLEVLVVDGMSDDGTAEFVERLAEQDSRVRLLNNPERTVPHAMNLAIEQSRGNIIIRVDGHAEVSPSFLHNSVQELVARPECWCVGGPIESVNDTTTGRVIAAAMSCPVGVGNARFRTGGYEGYVDTLAFGAYRRDVFERIGGFDTDLLRNQDDELNARLIEAGGKIYLSQSIRSRYFPRTSLGKLWKQYYQYGFWRIRTIQKRGKPATLRQVVPLAFVVCAVGLTVAAAIWPALRPVWCAATAIYLIALLIGAVMVSRQTSRAGFFLAPIVFAILHFAYGIGGIFGSVWFIVLRKTQRAHSLSR